MEYNKLTSQFKGCEDEFMAKVAEAKKSYDELVEKCFYSMRDKIVDVVKDISDEEFVDWLYKAKEDDAVSAKLFALVQVCRLESGIENHKSNKEDKTSPETFQGLIIDAKALSLLRRLI